LKVVEHNPKRGKDIKKGKDKNHFFKITIKNLKNFPKGEGGTIPQVSIPKSASAALCI